MRYGTTTIKTTSAFALLFLITGCISDADKLIVEDLRQEAQLNEQDASKIVLQTEDVAVKQLAQDIRNRSSDGRKGAETLQKNVTGLPSYHHTYTTELANLHIQESDANAARQRDLITGLVSMASGLSGVDILSIIAMLTTILGGGYVYKTQTAKTTAAEAEANGAVDSTTLALAAIENVDSRSKVVQQIKQLQERLKVREGIRKRIQK